MSSIVGGYVCSRCTLTYSQGVWEAGLFVCHSCAQYHYVYPTSTTTSTTGTGINIFADNRLDILSVFDIKRVNYHGACSACKEEGEIVIEYYGVKIIRRICQCCAISVIDKFFGVDSNVKLEKTLYGKN